MTLDQSAFELTAQEDDSLTDSLAKRFTNLIQQLNEGDTSATDSRLDKMLRLRKCGNFPSETPQK